jgi:hypothetical protein
MRHLDYSAAGVPVRDDLQATQRFLWEHIRAPGTWWTGAQRVAMAAEARHAATCELCRRRKAALSPNSVTGDHDTLGTLPASLVDVIHRIRTDPARLSRPWFEQVVASGLEAAAYVEVVGVVTMATGMDYFARALGIAPFEIPEPLAGEPSRYRPAAAKSGEAWVPMIAAEDASGPEADLYGGARMAPNIMRALSSVPAEARALHRATATHYLAVKQIPDPSARRGALDRLQTELVAARVSALNECFY